jgi:dipeptidyl aminopeptidase/acylaminoacyl peptidase
MRRQSYPGSDIVIEETLPAGANYNRYIASYKSEGLKIYALLTVPKGEKPATGWPVVIFNHGYIPPAEYRTTERYVAYVDAFARSGYIVVKSDYRGHGKSEGSPSSGSISPDYTIDVLNAVASIKRFRDADPKRIGMWGHSMGGSITLRAMVTISDIKAGDIWAGVVGTYAQQFERWDRRPATIFPSSSPTRRWRDELAAQFGAPQQNPAFWDSITPNAYVRDLSGPVLIQHGTADASVPLEFSETLYQQIKAAGKPVEIFTYPGDDHNIGQNLGVALQRSLAFMDRHVKNPAPAASVR